MGTASNMKLSSCLSKLIVKKFPSKKGTAILLSCWFAFIGIFLLCMAMQAKEYHDGTVAEYPYRSCDGFKLVTENKTITIDTPIVADRAKIREDFSSVSPGDRIRVRTSAFTDEAIEVYKGDQLIYKHGGAPDIGAVVFLAILMASPAVALIVILNLKHPSKRLRKIQRKLIG